jgi:LysR family hydrogen peroxide-inducible transcriptional activator
MAAAMRESETKVPGTNISPIPAAMNVERPTVRQLEYLIAVAQHRSFRKAAAATFVSQPGLSAQVARAEELIGVKVFERDRRHVLVTPAGEAVVRAARQILADLDELMRHAQAESDPLAGDLKLGVIPTVAPYVLPRILPAIRKQFPQLRLWLREDQTARLVRQLHGAELDLLLLALDVDLGDVDTEKLFDDPFLLVAPTGHRLATAKRIKAADLEDEPVLLLEEGHCMRAQALDVCRRGGATEHGDVRATSLGTLVQMVAGGLGVTLLPGIAVAAETRAERRLAVVPFAPPVPTRPIGLAWRKASPRATAFATLGAVIESRIDAS